MSGLTGRFLSRDPIGFKGSEWDLYELFNTKVLVERDPSGLGGGGALAGFARCCGGVTYDSRTNCCDGSNIISMRSCEVCCSEVRRIKAAQNTPIKDYGFTACCDGKWCACNTKDTWTHITNSKSKDIIASCVDKHEKTHFPDHPDPCECGKIARRGQQDRYWEDWNECEGYSTEYSCLRRNKSLCNGDLECEYDVEQRMGSVVLLAQGHHHCWTWTW